MIEPLVSVVVPIYNVEAYLSQCIESIVTQSYTNLDILLIDDGSPDNCGAICDRWAEKDGRIRVVHKENGGLSDARNTGMALASGDYLMMPDSDDYLLPDAILTMVQYARKYHTQCVLGGFQRLFPDGSLHPFISCDAPVICTNHQDIETNILYRLIGAEYKNVPPLSQSACVKLYDLHFIHSLNLHFSHTQDIGSEDFYFNICLFSKANCAVIIPENNYIYRYNPHSITTTFTPDRANRLIRLYNRMKQQNVLSDETKYQQMLAANILGGISVHIKQLIESHSVLPIQQIKQLMNTSAVREMLNHCCIRRIKFPLSLFCFLMKYKMRYVLYLLIRLFLIVNKES